MSGPAIDPFFSSARLRFRLACDDRFDCRQAAAPPAPEPDVPVVIDYLSKDYAGFRQALLDFIATRQPDWTERSEADIGMMLLELFAATADTLSYLQDRVANEAFLPTAPQRRSVAGHLALIGYQMDEGASAYTWLQFQVNDDASLPSDFQVAVKPTSSDEPAIVFEPLGSVRLDPALNQISLYDWGNPKCCVPRQALSAALVGSFDLLQTGDYLLFDNGQGARDVVRLTAPPQIVPAASASSPPSSPPSVPITVVTWSAATPLHADYCLSHTVVRGNLVPATHGQTILNETLRSLSPQQAAQVNAAIAARNPALKAPRQSLTLAMAPLAHLDPATLGLANELNLAAAQPSQADFTARSPRSVSQLQVLSVDGVPWQQVDTLLDSQATDQVFRVEIEDDGEATVVFGDGTFGQSPAEDATVTATYRVGGGAAGNVGPDTLTQASSAAPLPWLISVTNPVPAIGGRDLESADHARRIAPATFRQPLSAVTADDYETAAGSLAGPNGGPVIQRANASFRWTGSWLTVTLSADPIGTEGLPSALQQQLVNYLDARRLAGYDLEVTGPAYASVEMVIGFSVASGAEQSAVEQALLQAFSNGSLADGRQGFFHPDNFTFGDNLYVSRIYAAAMAVPGVQSALITRLARLHAALPDRDTAANLAQGFLPVGADEIIRLDNDPNFPQNGTLSVVLQGGAS